MSEHTIKEAISKNITKYREAANLSQKELAKRLGVVPSRVSNWENGANCPTIDILFKVCEVLGVSINDIYGIYPDSKIRLTYDEIEHIKKFRNLDSLGQEIVSYILDREAQRSEQLAIRDSQITELKSRSASIKEYPSLVRDPDADYLKPQAAHARTDIEITDEMIQNDDDIMNDENF